MNESLPKRAYFCNFGIMVCNLPLPALGFARRNLVDQMKHLDRVRKAQWIAMGLFAPELAVYNARMQRRKVNRVTSLARQSQILAKSQGIPQPIE